MPRRLERQLARLRSGSDGRPSSARRRSSSTSPGVSAHRTRCRPEQSPCAGRRSSARRFCIPPSSWSATSSSATGCDTTRASRRARTTSCGRVCSTSRTATTCPTRSSSIACTPRRRRSGVASSSASVSCGSRAGAIAALAPELSADEVELAWRVGSAERDRALASPRLLRDAYLASLAAFERRDGPGARAQAARDVARVATHAAVGSRARLTARSAAAGSWRFPCVRWSRRARPPQCCRNAPRSRGLAAPALGRRGRSDPRRGGLSRADAVPGAASRSRRGQLRDRPDGDLRRRNRRRSDVARRAEAPSRLPARSAASWSAARPAPRLPGDAREWSAR